MTNNADQWTELQHYEVQQARNVTLIACMRIEEALAHLDNAGAPITQSVCDLADGLARTLSVLRTDLQIIDNAIKERL